MMMVTKSPKEKLLLQFINSSGLRYDEVAKLQKEDLLLS
jgi:hypothetical protein